MITAFSNTDTIFALATAKGRSGVCVIRISGDKAAYCHEVLTGQKVGHAREFVLHSFINPNSGELIDRGLSVFFQSPKSFTGENVIELHLHGSLAVQKDIYAVLLQIEGVRPAQAGEFTRRAFFNGKLNLLETEGLANLIDAETSFQRRLALRHYSGQATEIIDNWRNKLLEARALLEATIDFVDEDDVPKDTYDDVLQIVRELHSIFQSFQSKSKLSDKLMHGYRVVLAGEPNAGKSSFFNALLNRDAAIVSSIAGTTRDKLEAHLDLAGLPITLIDTAGLRESDDEIEREGVKRTIDALLHADLILWLSENGFESDYFDENAINVEIWKVQTKLDLNHKIDSEAKYSIHIADEAGISRLLSDISNYFETSALDAVSSVVVDARQNHAFSQCIENLERFLNEYNSQPIEILIEYLRSGTDSLSFIVGRIGVEDVLGGIFSRFCVGK